MHKDPVLSDNHDSDMSEQDGDAMDATDDEGEWDDSERKGIKHTEDRSTPPLDGNDIHESKEFPYDADFAPASATVITLDDSGNNENVSFIPSK